MSSTQNKLAVYLAARYSRRDEIKQKAVELETLGITVTAQWLDESAAPTATLADIGEDYSTAVAKKDIYDIDRADVLVLFSEDPIVPHVRGGRHFETGYAYAKGKVTIVLGPKENVFHYLPNVIVRETWNELVANLTFLQQVKQFE